jgi:hypothetical protein
VATVTLAGRQRGGSVRLSWAAKGAAGFRLKVSEDGGPARVLVSGTQTAAAFPLGPRHAYVFTVEAVDGGGAVVAGSSPYRVTPAGTAGARRLTAR